MLTLICALISVSIQRCTNTSLACDLKQSMWFFGSQGPLHFDNILPQTHLRPAAVSQTPWRPLCWRQRHPLAADPGSPPSDSPSRGSQTYPARCRLSCAICQNKYRVSVNRQLDGCILCLQVRLRITEALSRSCFMLLVSLGNQKCLQAQEECRGLISLTPLIRSNQL